MSRIAAVLPAAVVAGLALESGGYFPRAWVWSSVVLLWLAALVLVVGGRVVLGRSGALFVGAAAALTAWTLVSVTWSIARSESVLDARRDVVYIAGALVVVVGASRVSVWILAAVMLTTVVGLARFIVSGPAPGQAEGQLLSWPVGYANAFAALAAIGLPLAVAAAAHERRFELRTAAAASVPLLLAVPVLTSSRGGAVATVVGLGCLGALDVRRRTLARVALRLAPAAVVAVGVSAAADLTGAATHLGLRRAVTGVALLLAVAAAAAAVQRAVGDAPGRPLPGRVTAAAAVVGVVLAVVLSAAGGAGSQRNAYWHVARQVVAAHPGLGTGAGGFGPEWFARGDVQRYGGALDAHNLYLETLAELGPIGLVLLLVFLAVPLARARTDAVAASAYIAFLVHALLDWDWEMPVVTLAAVLLGGSLLLPQRGRALPERTRFVLAAVAVALALAALVGLRSDAVPGAAAGLPAAAPVKTAQGLP
jgi:O-antigen ligase/polysaccharide polymerase Wzy-like membrane protein